MVKKLWTMLMVALAGCILSGVPVQAGEIELLVDKLVEKGVLSSMEAQILLDETKHEVSKQLSAGKLNTLPEWVQKTKINGDLRLRYQMDKAESADRAKHRGRVRFRLGVESQITDQLKVGGRIVTGSSDGSDSTNQTFGGNFEKKDIWLDKAYAEYTPLAGLSIIGGKFARKSYLWAPTDMLWDGDINPEGGAVSYETSLLENVDVFGNAGIFIIDEIGSVATSATDPFLHYFQGGLKFKEGMMDAKLAAIYYGFNGIQGRELNDDRGSNTTLAGSSALKYDYNSVGGSWEVGFKKLLGGLPYDIDERIAFFGDFITNTYNVADDEDTGWSLGVKFGNKKVKKPGQWQAKYIYAELEQDAFPDAYPDSDRRGGATNTKAHEFVLNYGWMKNVTLGLDYYFSNVLEGADAKEHLVQLDTVVKF